MERPSRTVKAKRSGQGDSLFFKGLQDGFPICVGYLSVSFVFGMLCLESGLGIGYGLLISATNLTSAGQFAGLELILAGAPLLEIAITTLVINIRYTLMSLSLSQKVRLNGWQRAIISFGNTDEVFAVAMQAENPLSFSYMLGLIATPYLGWTVGTLLGGTVTSLLPLSLRSAMGIAIYGMFIAILVPPAKKLRPVLVTCVLALALSCAFSYAPWLRELSSGWTIILCALLAAGFAAWRYPVPVEDAMENEGEGGEKT